MFKTLMNVTLSLRLAVWEKAKIEPGFDPKMFRKDACGAWMVWDKYGVHDNIYGWEIDHIFPKSILEKRGYSADRINHIDNLRALQHENNAAKGDDYPSYTALVTSEGKKNIYKTMNLVVNAEVREILGQLF